MFVLSFGYVQFRVAAQISAFQSRLESNWFHMQSDSEQRLKETDLAKNPLLCGILMFGMDKNNATAI